MSLSKLALLLMAKIVQTNLSHFLTINWSDLKRHLGIQMDCLKANFTF